jgi:polyisoprenoid-binding protein YceI
MTTAAVETGLFVLDSAASTVTLKHKTMWGLVTVKGTFTSVTGQGEVRADGTATGTVGLDVASLETRHAKRDAHLRSDDFFAADQFPAIVFDVLEATRRGDGTVTVHGRLTVRGITRPQTVTATLTQAGPDGVTLTTEFTVDRTEFGLTWNQMGMMRGLATVDATLRFQRTSA